VEQHVPVRYRTTEPLNADGQPEEIGDYNTPQGIFKLYTTLFCLKFPLLSMTCPESSPNLFRKAAVSHGR
jgi:hypothetical protein